MTRQQAWRLWRAVHLALALTFGAVIVVLGISGAALVLKGPLLWADFGAAIFDAPIATGPVISVDRWADSARRAKPGARIIAVAAPDASPIPTHAALVTVALPDGDFGFVSIDPRDGRALGFFPYGRGALFSALNLHRHLLLPETLERTGEAIVVGAGFALLLSAGTGLVLWSRSGAAERRRRMHVRIALAACAPLLILGATGLLLAMPQPASNVAAAPSAASRCRPVAGFDAALDAIGTLLVGARLREISPLPDGGYAARMRRADQDMEVRIEKCGQVLARRVSPIPDLVRRLHSGAALGWPGRLMVLLAGLVLPVLYGSGLWIWLGRRRRAAA